MSQIWKSTDEHAQGFQRQIFPCFRMENWHTIVKKLVCGFRMTFHQLRICLTTRLPMPFFGGLPLQRLDLQISKAKRLKLCFIKMELFSRSGAKVNLSVNIQKTALKTLQDYEALHTRQYRSSRSLIKKIPRNISTFRKS